MIDHFSRSPNSHPVKSLFFPRSLLVHVQLELGQNPKLRVANPKDTFMLDLVRHQILCTSTPTKRIS